MEASEYKNVFENEASHFFYLANHRIILDLVRGYSPGKNLNILDAGCGTGLLAKQLEKFGQVWGVDISREALKFARKRGVRVKKASVTKLPFPNDTFDLVTSIDVIYHLAVASDTKALREFFRVLRPRGILILRVPAVKWLRSAHDKHVHTRERYDKAELRTKLKRAGFILRKLSFVNLSLFPLAVFRHFWEKLNPPRKTSSAIAKIPAPLNSLIAQVLSFEGNLLALGQLPFGIGLIAVCQKPMPRSSLG